MNWNNSPRIDMSLHSDTLFWFRANRPLLFLLNAACLAEKQQIRTSSSSHWKLTCSRHDRVRRNRGPVASQTEQRLARWASWYSRGTWASNFRFFQPVDFSYFHVIQYRLIKYQCYSLWFNLTGAWTLEASTLTQDNMWWELNNMLWEQNTYLVGII
jgi:hypothetical protein